MKKFVGNINRGRFLLGIKSALICAVAISSLVSFAEAKDQKAPKPPADPRETYTKDNWKLIWSEEFNVDGTPSRDVWHPEVGFIRNHEPQYYTNMRPENCFVKNGVLSVVARKEVFPNADYLKQKSGWKYSVKEAQYTSADIVTKRTFLYGRIEVSACMPKSHGAWPAIWTLGDSLRKPMDDPEYYNWPCCGEIDIVEIWCNNPYRVAACLHSSKIGTRIKPNEQHKVTGGGDITCKKPGMEPFNGFHTYTLDWYEDKIVMFYDGKCYAKVDLNKSNWPNGENPFRKPHFLLLNLALGGYGNKVDERSVFPMEMKVDYVRYYQKQ